MPEPDQLVHWRCLDAQEVFIPPSDIRRPTRCGLFDGYPALGNPLKYVTCPQCLELAASDGDDDD